MRKKKVSHERLAQIASAEFGFYHVPECEPLASVVLLSYASESQANQDNLERQGEYHGDRSIYHRTL